MNKDFRHTEELMINKINELKWPKTCIENWVIKIWTKKTILGPVWEEETLENLQRETAIFIYKKVDKFMKKQKDMFVIEPEWVRECRFLLRTFPYN